MRLLFSFFFLFIVSMQSVFCEEATGEFFGSAISISGTVLVTRGLLEFEAKPEEAFQYDDEIETGENGHLQISFGSSFASVGPNTLFSITKRRDAKVEMVSLYLEKGKFRSKVFLEDKQGYEVASDSGKAVVTGTDFVTSFDPEDRANFSISVLSGRVGMETPEQDEGPKIWLDDKQMRSINDKGRAADPVNLSNETIESIKTELPLPGDNKQEDVAHEKEQFQELNKVDIPSLDRIVFPEFNEEIAINISPVEQQVAENIVTQTRNIQEDVASQVINDIPKLAEQNIRVSIDFAFEVD